MLMDEERVEVQPTSRSSFTKEQKFGYAVVIACGVLAVTFGMFYMVKHVKAPFIVTYDGSKLLTGDDAKAAEVAAQKAADTDDDGVSDYDETKIYGTSPYLSDTDSDGIDDGTEIRSNMDPTCARGTECTRTVDDIEPGTSIDDGLVGETQATAAAEAAAAKAEVEQMKVLLGNATPDEIRALLVESGVPQANVDAMTDEEITTLYAGVVSELEQNGGLEQLIRDAQTVDTTQDTSPSAPETQGTSDSPTITP